MSQRALATFLVSLTTLTTSSAREEPSTPKVGDVARRFYKKHLDVHGIAVLAAGEVADEALVRTHHIVTHVLAGRPGVVVLDRIRTRIR